jgi:hypothetical protein
MEYVIAPLVITACILLPQVGAALAGQPGTNAGVNCGASGTTTSGSPFNATSTPGGSGSAGGLPSRGERRVMFTQTRLTVVVLKQQPIRTRPRSTISPVRTSRCTNLRSRTVLRAADQRARSTLAAVQAART